MKVALTGASGHLGAALLQELNHRNIPVKALIRGNDTRTCQGLAVEIVKGDLLDEKALTSLVQDCDMIIHSAALISVNGDRGGLVQRTNVEGTRLIVETSLRAGIKRFIHISSIHAYNQKPSNELLDENRRPVDERGYAYDRSKQAGKEIALNAKEQGMEVLVMHPTSIMGPYDHKPSLVGKVLIDLYSGKLPFVFKGGFDFCDGRDVAKAIVNSLTLGNPGESYLLAGKWHSLGQVAKILSQVSGKKINQVSLPAFIAYTGLPFVKLWGALRKKEPLYTMEALDALFNGNRYISSAKAKNELNYSARPLEETISDTVQWFRNNGYL